VAQGVPSPLSTKWQYWAIIIMLARSGAAPDIPPCRICCGWLWSEGLNCKFGSTKRLYSRGPTQHPVGLMLLSWGLLTHSASKD
jgi:hypothetical protein